MTTLLSGLHDREGAGHVPPGGWIVDTRALSESPQPTDYAALAPGVNWIGRLNWGYYPAGTIPHPDQHGEMAQRAALYVAESRGCTRWIIGNESNHSQERPGGRMQRLGRQWTYLHKHLTLEEELDSINAVTIDDMRAVFEAFPFSPRTVGRMLPA